MRHEIRVTSEIKSDEKKFNFSKWCYETIESETSQNHFAKLLKNVKPGDEVVLYINCLGGSVQEALGIHSELKRCGAKVVAHIDGFAASAASVLAMAADEVIMPRNTCMMLHKAAWQAYGNPDELRKSADDLEVISKTAAESYLMKAGEKMDSAALDRILAAGTWISAADCLTLGLCDKLESYSASGGTPMQKFQAAASACVHYPIPEIPVAFVSMLEAMSQVDEGRGIAENCPESGHPENHETQPEAAVNHGIAYAMLKNMNL